MLIARGCQVVKKHSSEAGLCAPAYKPYPRITTAGAPVKRMQHQLLVRPIHLVLPKLPTPASTPPTPALMTGAALATYKGLNRPGLCDRSCASEPVCGVSGSMRFRRDSNGLWRRLL